MSHRLDQVDAQLAEIGALVGDALLTEPRALTWAVDGLIPDPGTALVTAPDKAGKTALAHSLVLARLVGGVWLGREVAASKARALVITPDEPGAVRRIAALAPSFGTTLEAIAPRLVVMPRPVTLIPKDARRGVHEDLEVLGSIPWSIVVVDVLPDCMPPGAKENDAEPVRLLARACRELVAEGGIVVGLHHTGHRGGVDSRAGRGSTAWPASFDTILTVERDRRAPGAGVVHATMRHARPPAAIGYALNGEADAVTSITWSATPPATARGPSSVERASRDERIAADVLERLRRAGGPVTLNAIRERGQRTELDGRRAKAALEMLVAKGAARHRDDGRWEATSTEEKEPDGRERDIPSTTAATVSRSPHEKNGRERREETTSLPPQSGNGRERDGGPKDPPAIPSPLPSTTTTSERQARPSAASESARKRSEGDAPSGAEGRTARETPTNLVKADDERLRNLTPERLEQAVAGANDEDAARRVAFTRFGANDDKRRMVMIAWNRAASDEERRRALEGARPSTRKEAS